MRVKTYCGRRTLAGKRFQSPGPIFRHLRLKYSSDALEDKVIVQLDGRDSVGIEWTTHVAKFVRPFLEWADSAADEGSHQVLAA